MKTLPTVIFAAIPPLRLRRRSLSSNFGFAHQTPSPNTRKPLHENFSCSWRMGWDSNPRNRCRFAGFQDRSLQPLGHPSVPTVPSPSDLGRQRKPRLHRGISNYCRIFQNKSLSPEQDGTANASITGVFTVGSSPRPGAWQPMTGGLLRYAVLPLAIRRCFAAGPLTSFGPCPNGDYRFLPGLPLNLSPAFSRSLLFMSPRFWFLGDNRGSVGIRPKIAEELGAKG